MLLRDRGWTFDEGPGVIPDPIFGASASSEFYVKARPDYTGRVTVPVLWDKKRGRSSITNRPRSSACSTAPSTASARRRRLYPTELSAEIDALNARIYATVNNGVYRAGFATTQEAYEEAFRRSSRRWTSWRRGSRASATSWASG